ncbi:hypothetical protein DACRYDRAFT_61457 [Dacryopinax primogenitus]|uniref:GRAM domain-containing protein n=1 Tax=Dacryopinax primogenitus (strain DJM 731) TaxID=1858805 RepID=M5G8U9_DACPD|nr:uncharacterized protein DACRYDRAFT_61457 [Dacryopinax primogenitus]EJU06636.1 hypothetical protein DACRYDRAFT_61457 [Dacryopinax primogenitus]
MSLNWAMLDPANSQPIPLPEEEMILHLSGAEFTLLVPDAPPPTSGAQSAGGAGGNPKRSVATGTVWVSDHRVIFVPIQAKDVPYHSLSLPHNSILSTSFQQPIFGSNHVILSIAPTTGGGLTQGTKAEVRFKDRGVFEFVKVLEAARERSINRERERGEEGLPMYEAPPPPVGASGTAPTGSSHAVHEDAPPGYEL